MGHENIFSSPLLEEISIFCQLLEWPLKLPLITAKRPLQLRKGKIPQQKWTGNTKKQWFWKRSTSYNLFQYGKFWHVLGIHGKFGETGETTKTNETSLHLGEVRMTFTNGGTRVEPTGQRWEKKGKGWWREVDVDLVVSGKIIYRENGGTLGMVPYIPNKYQLYIRCIWG